MTSDTSDTSEKSSIAIAPETETDNVAESPPEKQLEQTEDGSTGEEEADEKAIEAPPHLQPRFKTKDGRLWLILPPETDKKNEDAPPVNDWQDIWQALKHRLNAGDRFWQPNTPVHLIAQERLLDVRQLQAIGEALTEAKLYLSRVYTARRQTAVAAATAGYSVEQRSNPAAFNLAKTPNGQALADPLYMESTIRSGVEIRHEGTVVIRGDVNPGGSVVADGDILIWGRLRGIVHAGARGDDRAIIMALEMEPTQIRIGDYVARSPESPPEFYPEVAYVSSEGIHIAGAVDFAKPSSSGS